MRLSAFIPGKFVSHLILAGILVCITQGCIQNETEQLYAAVEKGAVFLKDIQRGDSAICDTTDALFDVWETVLAASALHECKVEDAEKAFREAEAFLMASEDSAGMVCHNRKCRQAYCLETTAEYFLLMSAMGDSNLVRTRVDTVIAMQKPTGEWQIGNPDVNERKDFPSVTAFVLAMLYEAGATPRYEKEAMAWLRNAQQEEGHWGVAWEYYECPAYALWPVMRALSYSDAIGDINARNKAVEYILRTQKPDGSWEYLSPGHTRLPSAELQTALMLSALRYSDLSKTEKAISLGCSYLRSHQREDGSWNGGFFPVENKRQPKHEYVFATSRAMSVLNWWAHEKDKAE